MPAPTLLRLLLLSLALSASQAWAQLTILSYHEITEPEQALVPQYAVSPTLFVRHLDWLKNQGYQFVSLGQVIQARQGGPALPEKAVLITFDDGYRSVYTQALPILKLFQAPAVIAVVGQWMDSQDTLRMDGQTVARERLLSWAELKAMADSGLVEVASHSHDLHQGVVGNPQGNRQAAATTRRYLGKGQYEKEEDYRRRVSADLRRSSQRIKQEIGRAPRAMVWPYGRYNASSQAAAQAAGLSVGLTLDDGANTPATPLSSLRRVLVERGMTPWQLGQEVAIRNADLSDNDRPQKIMHVDLDYIYDPDPAHQEHNLGRLLDRIQAMGVNTVYLQAFADPDGNGAADAVYFPNRTLPLRADLFNRVAWQIRTRTPVRRLYAWMPVLAWELPAGHPAAQDKVQTLQASDKGTHLNMGYPRLSPFSPRARAAIAGLYQDLARSAPLDGLIFHDDLTLSDYEDASPAALQTYASWGLPADIQAIRASDDLIGRWTILKINALDNFARELAAVVRQESPQLKTARNLYAQVALNPRAEVWYAQSLDNSLANYDFTAIMAMPYMEQAQDPAAFMQQMVAAVKDRPQGLRKTVFELQATDWRHNRLIPTEEIAETVRQLYRQGVLHTGYYPDNLHRDHPDPALLKPVFDSLPNAPQLP